MSDDRPRKSWRERDRQKDRSQHRREEPSAGVSSRRREQSQKSYRARLDRLFDSGRMGRLIEDNAGSDGGAERLKLLKAITTAEGRAAVTAAVDAYLTQYDPPADVEVLAKLLEHRDAQVQLDGMRRLREALSTERPRRTRAIIGQLKLIGDTSDDEQAQALAKELIDRLEST